MSAGRWFLVVLLMAGEAELLGSTFSPPFVARDGAIRRVGVGSETPFFVHAVNLGVAVPGTQPGELAATRDQYDRWLSRIHSMGFTAVRIYTLHFPRFYEALRDFNAAHPDTPLYVLHGIWLDEDYPQQPASLDLHDLTPLLRTNITDAVGAVHGAITIPQRVGRAHGSYTADVSPWVMGWILGREVYPEEVFVTDLSHPGDRSFRGARVVLPSGSPTECWIAAQLDFLALYEHTNFGAERMLSFSNWPTLDPLSHPSERPDSGEDSETIDLANLDTSRFAPGFFASFHIYPYFPNFIGEDPAYADAVDAYGPNPYVAYLEALRAHYDPMPLFVAEFGVPSSWGNAHEASSGMSHGGHDEEAQGLYAVRLFENITDIGCAGGSLFAWIDEWWKNTWVTDELDFASPPFARRSRRPLWHNILDPEQNFGLVAFDEAPTVMTPVELAGFPGPLASVAWAVTHRFLLLELNTDTTQWPLVIGFDTYRDDLGESVLPGGRPSPVRSELALVIGEGEAQFYATEAYNLYAIWHEARSELWDPQPGQLYRSIAADGAPWIPVRWLTNPEHENGVGLSPETVDEVGRLKVSLSEGFQSSTDAVAVGQGTVKLRIPWTLLQFTDPSRGCVLDDDQATPPYPYRETAFSEGIRLVLAQGTGLQVSGRLRWDGWNIAPPTAEREKAALGIVEDYLMTVRGIGAHIEIVAHTTENLTLQWRGGGVLEAAPGVNGPWTPVGQVSPTVVDLKPSGHQWFRVSR